MKYSLIAGAALAALAANTSAQANGVCHHGAACFQKVTTPPVYGTFSRSVLVAPQQTTFAKIPAQYATTAEQMMVRPAQQVPHHHPAITRTVSEQVMIQPASRVWSVTRDAHGREVGCWINKPAVYGTQQRTIVVQPASVSYSTIPAEYRTVHRQVVVSPARLVAQTTPAVYSTQTYQAQVSPGSTSWQPIGHRGHHGHHGHQHHRRAHH